MSPWWRKSSSKEAKKKGSKDSLIDTLHQGIKSPSDDKLSIRSGGSRRHLDDTVSEMEAQSRPESKRPANLSLVTPTTPRSPSRTPLGGHVPTLQVPHHGAFYSAPDSSMPSPSRSPLRGFGTDQVANSAQLAGRPYTDANLLGSGHCSGPGSGYNSGHNSMGGDIAGQLFHGSAECSPISSPRMASPGPCSRLQSGAVTPIHPRAGGSVTIESQTSWPEDGKQQTHRLPLPPVTISNSSPGSRWKKGKLLGRGTFSHVYVGFNSESGEMCAMKEVTSFSDDARSNESAKQLMQEIATLSRLRHPNIVQYYGSEQVDDKLYIYLEYVPGGSIYRILQDYGQLGEPAIRSYTQQILSGLEFLHSKSIVHRDIKAANILVDQNGRVKVADFGLAKEITGLSCPFSFKGSPYWMAPEVIKNSSGCNIAVDIWSLGCTVLEMATTKPPWCQYEEVAAMFKIGCGKDLPAIPDQLSDEGKDFVRQCLQRNPLQRRTAAQLLDHPFLRSAAPLERPVPSSESADTPPGLSNGVKALGLAVHSSRVSRSSFHASDIHIPRNISCPVSPISRPLLHSRSPQHLDGRSISNPTTNSGPSTSLTDGTGAIPFNHTKHSACFQDGAAYADTSKPSSNGSSYHDADTFRGMQQPGNGPNKSELGEAYDGQSVLADRVPRQLLMDYSKLNTPLDDLSPKSPLPRRTDNGI